MMDVHILEILPGNLAFNYFFTIVFYMGLIAVVPAQIFKLLR